MKKVFFLVTALFVTLFGASAQSVYGDDAKADVKMKYVYSFEEALVKSKKEGKLIFFNCFADWAVPCHLMNQVVFSDQEFADWMDKHFVNFFIDVTTREGRPLAEKYDIQRMAHYLVLDSEGNVVHRIIGGHEVPKFKSLLEKALNPKRTFAAVKARYEAGDRKVKFLREAYETFDVAYEQELKKEVLDQVFATLKPKEWAKKENWVFFSQKAGVSTNNEYFKYLVDHKADFLKENDKKDVDRLLSGGYFGDILSYATGSNEYDENKFLEIYAGIQKCDLPDSDATFTLYRIAKARGEKKYAELIRVMEEETGEWEKSFMLMLDTSFGSLQGLSVEDRDLFVDYLKRQSEGMPESVVRSYYSTARSLVNKDGVRFERLSFADALKKAEVEEKLVFMDCYTVWCGPCKRMNEQVFPLKSVGDFFNKHFVNLKIDMEGGEGPELAKKYGVDAFPTMFILNGKGEVVHKMVGGRGEKALLEEVQKVLN